MAEEKNLVTFSINVEPNYGGYKAYVVGMEWIVHEGDTVDEVLKGITATVNRYMAAGGEFHQPPPA